MAAWNDLGRVSSQETHGPHCVHAATLLRDLFPSLHPSPGDRDPREPRGRCVSES